MMEVCLHHIRRARIKCLLIIVTTIPLYQCNTPSLEICIYLYQYFIFVLLIRILMTFCSDLDIVRPGPTHINTTIGGKNGSHIPVLTKSSATDECEALRKQVTDLKAQVHHLENTLKATEETVHCQTQKMKHYRNMLIENGLLSRSRSSSVSDLPSARTTRPMTRKMSADSVAPRCRSMSPTHVGRKSVESSEEFDRLVKVWVLVNYVEI